uniref:Uncharacterized protein n=1 Tax=Mus musculus TaxID=10090 RepID=Q3TYI1_MOUSE|nr:unnamed protein product [Mus musculus]
MGVDDMSPLLSEQMMAKLRLSPQAFGHARSPGRTQEMSALRHCHCSDKLRVYGSGELKEAAGSSHGSALSTAQCLSLRAQPGEQNLYLTKVRIAGAESTGQMHILTRP